MRAIALLLFCLLALPACDRSTGKLEELSYGNEFEGDYQALLDRALFLLHRQFPLGLDPDRTKAEEGDFWTVWHYRMSTMYYESTRLRAHVVVENLGEGKVRLGVSVVSQINDNIDNPSVKEEARWVKTTRDSERIRNLEAAIARRYLKVEPSELWKEKHREKKRGGMRPDILDRTKDVNLEELGKPDDPDKEAPAITGPDKGTPKGDG